MPYLPVGSAPLVTVSCAVCGFTLTVARTTSQSQGPDPEVQRAGLLGDVDREAEGGAVVGAGQEHLAAA